MTCSRKKRSPATLTNSPCLSSFGSRAALSPRLHQHSEHHYHHRQIENHRNTHRTPHNRCRKHSLIPSHNFSHPRTPSIYENGSAVRRSASSPFACAANQITVYSSRQSSLRSRPRQQRRSHLAHVHRYEDSEHCEVHMHV